MTHFEFMEKLYVFQAANGEDLRHVKLVAATGRWLTPSIFG